MRQLSFCFRVCILCIGLSTLFLPDLYSQSASSVQIRVIDDSSGEPISNARIQIFETGQTQQNSLASGTTSLNGELTVQLPAVADIDIVATHPDYMRNLLNGRSPASETLTVEMARTYSFRIGGVVTDGITGKPVPEAQLEIISENENVHPARPVGTSTDRDGEFLFGFSYSRPITVRVTHVSYFPTEREISGLNVEDLTLTISPKVFQEEDIVVTADMVTEEEMKSTNTIERVTSVDVQQLSSFDAFDLVSTLREVDVATQSMNMQTINARGFNSGANNRVLQLTDGVDSQAPGLGFPVGNLLGPSELDIARMEMLLGPSSSVYGPSAMNGVLQVQSKSPFDSKGLSFQVKGGVNDLSLGGATQFGAEGNGMTDMSARYANTLGSRVAFKVTGSWLTGTDWLADNYDNIGTGEPWQTYADVHGYNGVNTYGDEAIAYYPLGNFENDIREGILVGVTRDGYREEDLVDYDIETRKAAASLHFRPTPESELVIGGRYGYTNTLYTNDSRIRLEDFEIIQGSAEFTAPNFFLRGYRTMQFSGNSYDVVYMANQLQESAKSNADWFRDYRFAYEFGIPIRGVIPNNLRSARNFANLGVTLLQDSEARAKLEPGTEEFNEEFNRLRSTYDFEDGAGIKDNSTLTHLEAGYTLNEFLNTTDLTFGGSFRFYDLQSSGTIFPDTTGNDITNYRYGGYVKGETQVLEDRLSIDTALRVDVNENFDPAISPQLGANLRIGDDQYIRASYQYGFRFPTVREQFLNQNLGNGRLLGGLSENLSRYRIAGNAVYEQTLDRFTQAVIDEMNEAFLNPNESITREQAELIHLGILKDGIVGEDQVGNIRPEKTHAFEVGYSNLFSTNLFVDLNYFVSFYTDFIGLTRAIKPRTSPSVDLFSAAGQLNNATQSDRFYYYSNASDRVSVHGFSFDLRQQAGLFFFGLNGTYTQLVKGSDDPLIPGFNTPPFKFNLEWGNRKISENVGFKMVYRYRSSYSWRSPFLDGELGEFGHFDFQVNTRIPQINSMIKAGLTNLGIKKYSNVFGGPAIGSIIFATFTYNPGML